VPNPDKPEPKRFEDKKIDRYFKLQILTRLDYTTISQEEIGGYIHSTNHKGQ
jgi:hypothetical protein